MTTQTFKKFLVPVLGIIAVAAAVLFGVDYLRYRVSPEYQLSSDMRKLEQAYEDDPYGGDTPEETLRLFIEALKREDIELAAKYFVLDKQQEWLIDLERIKDRGLLDDMVRDLGREKEKKPIFEGAKNNYNYFIYNDDNVLALIINIVRGSNGKWKIIDI